MFPFRSDTWFSCNLRKNNRITVYGPNFMIIWPLSWISYHAKQIKNKILIMESILNIPGNSMNISGMSVRASTCKSKKSLVMKAIKILVIFLISSLFVQAQGGDAPLNKGMKQLNFGLGFASYGIPTYIGIDFAIHDDWTLGPVARLIFDEDHSSFGALGRVDYHWNRLMGIPSNWDFYLGANVGVISGDDLDLDLGLQIGGRYYWSERWGVNLEIGGGTGYNSALGLSYRF